MSLAHRFLASVGDTHPSGVGLTFKRWEPLTPGNLQRMWDDSKEGVVFQHLFAPPGCDWQGVGTARYLKKRLTFDVQVDHGSFTAPPGLLLGYPNGGQVSGAFSTFTSGVFELAWGVDWVQVIRARPDKIVSNDLSYARDFSRALKLGDILAILSVKVLPGRVFSPAHEIPTLYALVKNEVLSGTVSWGDLEPLLQREAHLLAATYPATLMFPEGTPHFLVAGIVEMRYEYYLHLLSMPPAESKRYLDDLVRKGFVRAQASITVPGT